MYSPQARRLRGSQFQMFMMIKWIAGVERNIATDGQGWGLGTHLYNRAEMFRARIRKHGTTEKNLNPTVQNRE